MNTKMVKKTLKNVNQIFYIGFENSNKTYPIGSIRLTY